MKKYLLSLSFALCFQVGFAQQTDPTLTAAVAAQSLELKSIYKERKSLQEKILTAETAATIALDRVHSVENKMLEYLSNASAAMNNLYQLKRSAELVSKDIPQNINLVLKSIPSNLQGTAVTLLVSDEIQNVYSEMASLTPFLYQLVSSGSYDVPTVDGGKEQHKVNLLNAAERYYIANTVVSRLERINVDLFILAYQIRTLDWHNLWYGLDPQGWATIMSGKNRVDMVVSMWKKL